MTGSRKGIPPRCLRFSPDVNPHTYHVSPSTQINLPDPMRRPPADDHRWTPVLVPEHRLEDVLALVQSLEDADE